MKTEITRRWSLGESLKQIANALGVTRSVIAGQVFRMRANGEPLSKRVRISRAKPPPKQKLTRIIHAQQRRPCVKAASGAITIVELEPQHCRAIMDGRKNNLPTYCGKQKLENSSYCREHFEQYIGGRLR